jgi:acetyltransferase
MADLKLSLFGGVGNAKGGWQMGQAKIRLLLTKARVAGERRNPYVVASTKEPMKNITASLSVPSAILLPDFTGRPRRINLDQIVAVKGYGKLKIRPIQIEDELAMTRFHERLSEESIYMRYFEYLGLDRRTSHERLVRICTNTPESYAVVAEQPATDRRTAAILGVGRLTKTAEPCVAAFDTLISDADNSTQLCKVLLQRLYKIAHAFGFAVLTGELLVPDHDTLNVCRSLGFSLQTLPEAGLVRATIDL